MAMRDGNNNVFPKEMKALYACGTFSQLFSRPNMEGRGGGESEGADSRVFAQTLKMWNVSVGISHPLANVTLANFAKNVSARLNIVYRNGICLRKILQPQHLWDGYSCIIFALFEHSTVEAVYTVTLLFKILIFLHKIAVYVDGLNSSKPTTHKSGGQRIFASSLSHRAQTKKGRKKGGRGRGEEREEREGWLAWICFHTATKGEQQQQQQHIWIKSTATTAAANPKPSDRDRQRERAKHTHRICVEGFFEAGGNGCTSSLSHHRLQNVSGSFRSSLFSLSLLPPLSLSMRCCRIH